jgi:hypothetical protein
MYERNLLSPYLGLTMKMEAVLFLGNVDTHLPEQMILP